MIDPDSLLSLRRGWLCCAAGKSTQTNYNNRDCASDLLHYHWVRAMNKADNVWDEQKPELDDQTEPNPYQSPETASDAPETVATSGPQQPLSGLGGWLILVAIGVVMSPLQMLATLLQTYVPFFQGGTWEALTTPGSEQYHALWAPLIIFEFIGNLGLFVACVVLLFLFFKKSRFFPRTYIAIALVNLCYLVLDAWFVSFVLTSESMFDPDTTREIVRSLVTTAVWGTYMLISDRVRNTFVE